jgi:hypothetical protein
VLQVPCVEVDSPEPSAIHAQDLAFLVVGKPEVPLGYVDLVELDFFI